MDEKLIGPLLHELSIPSNRRPNANVIFLHGLGQDHAGSWINKESDGFYSNLIAEPSLRPYKVEYPTSFLGKERSFLVTAKLLARELAARFGSVDAAPVVLLGQSLGGVIAAFSMYELWKLKSGIESTLTLPQQASRVLSRARVVCFGSPFRTITQPASVLGTIAHNSHAGEILSEAYKLEVKNFAQDQAFWNDTDAAEFVFISESEPTYGQIIVEREGAILPFAPDLLARLLKGNRVKIEIGTGNHISQNTSKGLGAGLDIILRKYVIETDFLQLSHGAPALALPDARLGAYKLGVAVIRGEVSLLNALDRMNVMNADDLNLLAGALVDASATCARCATNLHSSKRSLPLLEKLLSAYSDRLSPEVRFEVALHAATVSGLLGENRDAAVYLDASIQSKQSSKDDHRITKIENLINDTAVKFPLVLQLSEIEEIAIENCNYCAAVRTRSEDRGAQYQRLHAAIERKLRSPVATRERRLLEIYKRSSEVTHDIDIVLDFLISDKRHDDSRLSVALNALSKRKNRWERYLTMLVRARARLGEDTSVKVMEQICATSHQRNFCQLPLLTLFRIAKAANLPIPDWVSPESLSK